MAASNDEYHPIVHYESLGDMEACKPATNSIPSLTVPHDLTSPLHRQRHHRLRIIQPRHHCCLRCLRVPTAHHSQRRSSRSLGVMPDLFRGTPADPDWFPTDMEEKAQAVDKFKPKAYNANLVPITIQSVADAKVRWPSVRTRGCFGLGWGGKVSIIIAAIATVPFCCPAVPNMLLPLQLVAQASGVGTPFKVSGQAYPS